MIEAVKPLMENAVDRPTRVSEMRAEIVEIIVNDKIRIETPP